MKIKTSKQPQMEPQVASPESEELKESGAQGQERTEGEEKQKNGVINTVVNILLVVAIILAAVCTYVSFVSTSGNGVPSILGIRPFSIQTDSMYPTLQPGDLIIDTAIRDTRELRIDDIITYWTIINGERVLNTHRITGIYDGGGHLIFSTKGDNNSLGDALSVHESEVVGKYSFRIAGVGKVFDYLQTSTGFLIVVVLPVFLFFLYHLVQFFRVLFEYQNVKNRIKYEQERGRTEDLIAEQKKNAEEEKEKAKQAMEAELRERLKAELLADMLKQQGVNVAAMAAATPVPEAAQPAVTPEAAQPAATTPVAAPEAAQPAEAAPASDAPTV